MKKIITIMITAVAAAAYALPGDVVVISDREVAPDEAAGLYYMGSCEAGYLYNGSSAAVGRAAPYRVLDAAARGKHYFLISLPKRTALTAADMAKAGDVQPLGDDYLLAVASRATSASCWRWSRGCASASCGLRPA